MRWRPHSLSGFKYTRAVFCSGGHRLDRSRWPSLESRAVANTEALLAIFAETGTMATSFVIGWVASRQDVMRPIADADCRAGELAHAGDCLRLRRDRRAG